MILIDFGTFPSKIVRGTGEKARTITKNHEFSLIFHWWS